MSLLRVQEITRTFARSERAAVNAVSFTMTPGELLVLAGESGSGKSTLLRLIAGLDRPDAGVIQLDGRTLSSPREMEAPERRGIGMVFQDHALFPHLTVEENIGFGLHRQPRSERRAKVAAMLELVELPGYQGRYPHELSGGERQRVALARSLAPAPRLLLLDEPFSSLDPRLRQEVRDHTRRVLKRHGTTAVVVSHDVQDTLSIADRVLLLRHGILQQDSAPKAIYSAPVNEYVATFFGPCNFLPSGVMDLADFNTVGPPAQGTGKVWVRPEDLTLRTPGEGSKRSLRGSVMLVTFCGDRQEVQLRCCASAGGEFPVLVHTPAAISVALGSEWVITARERADSQSAFATA